MLQCGPSKKYEFIREELKVGLRQRKLEHDEASSLTVERREEKRGLYHHGYQDKRAMCHSVHFLSLYFPK